MKVPGPVYLPITSMNKSENLVREGRYTSKSCVLVVINYGRRWIKIKVNDAHGASEKKIIYTDIRERKQEK